MNDALKPLQGVHILVTRAQHQSSAFIEQIQSFGGNAIEVPLLKIAPPKREDVVQDAFTQLNSYDWIIITSMNGAHAFVKFANKYANSDWKKKLPKIAAVGKKTLKTLQDNNIDVQFMPSSYTAEVLFAELSSQLKTGMRILLTRGDLARKALPSKLLDHGCKVNDLVVYRTIQNEAARTKLKNVILHDHVDVVTFTSPSTISAFDSLLLDTNWRDVTTDVIFACIGPVTLSEAKRKKLPNVIIAETYTIEGLLHKISEELSNRRYIGND
ncbi:uroporphyrinogen-III synthase [Bacillus solimangrovi]|uniref:Uroporphyrinogen-III synthase n=1 Tax=Bacillus solimangrovi TaxID=1305675 RepID=A0A1E5LBH8_9BACI|nr:uroporphyrinogen-III synthase [Bacillus solimangrovi]OEH91437.1 hypothetical protein BFG57_04805 [Bacillus solimangrovi]